MARGRKPALTLDEQLEKITAEIENMESSLKELKSAKKDLEEQIRMNRLAELDELITASGKSIDDIKELLSTEEQPIYSFFMKNFTIFIKSVILLVAKESIF